MRIFKRILSNIHRYVVCALLSVVFWAWIFSVVTDTVPLKKVTVLIDTPAVDELALAKKLKEDLPEGLRTVKVYPLSYMDFSFGMSDEGDIYILPESSMEKSVELLCPLEGGEGYVYDGRVYGLLIHEAGAENGGASAYITFGNDENYYLCFTKSSLHLGELNGSKDGTALEIAEKILALP